MKVFLMALGFAGLVSGVVLVVISLQAGSNRVQQSIGGAGLMIAGSILLGIGVAIELAELCRPDPPRWR